VPVVAAIGAVAGLERMAGLLTLLRQMHLPWGAELPGQQEGVELGEQRVAS